jgi:nucleoside phosphorylase/phosphohistidine swiveling domain-containing protein
MAKTRKPKQLAKPPSCVICTALPVEYTAVRAFLTDVEPCHDSDGTSFEVGLFKRGTTAWRVGLVETGVGNVPAALLTQNAIRYFEPELILFVGVAGGMKDVDVGDVVVATKVYDYARGKHTTDGFLPRAETRFPNYKLVQRAKALQHQPKWQSVHFGPLAAGEAVLASRDAELFKQLATNCSDALAVEMEGSGFLSATYVSNRDALIVRGISDLLTGKFDADATGSQQRASESASGFAFALLESTAPRPNEELRKSKARSSVRGAKRQPAARKQVEAPRTAYRTHVTSDLGVVTQVRGNIDSVRLSALVANHDWIVGAVNFDEDLHFSSFYTRQSCVPYLRGDLALFGYTALVATYEDFRETYFIPRSECVRVAKLILARLLDTPAWLQEILDQIYVRSKALQEVFTANQEPFETMTDAALLERYRHHNRAHARLYEVARIPEAMDRGVGHFTDYLKTYLRKRSGTLAGSPRELNKSFEVLTFPEEMSAVKREMGEFHDLLLAIRRGTENMAFLAGGGRRAWLRLPPELRSKIESHRKKWGYLGYHGYGTRTLPDLEHYMHRVSAALAHKDADIWTIADYSRVLAEGEEKRQLEFNRLRIDETHQMLFRLHSRVGIAKLYRRYAQLRNFAFLDQLLSDVSRRFECPEELVRCLLPEEVEELLSSSRGVDALLQSRATFAVHVVTADSECVTGGTEYVWLRERLAEASRSVPVSSTRLEGTPAYGGVVRGRCKIIVRASDAMSVGFRPGDLLLSEATDPDLVPLIEDAAGVVTEQGGVTSHAAIVCRELQKPVLVGVRGLLSVVKNDDYAVLNAEDGYLSVLRWEERRWIVPDARIQPDESHRFGNKASNLAKIMANGVQVPRFFVIALDLISEDILAAARDAAGPGWEALRREMSDSLEYLNGNLFVVRSSGAAEDSATESHAGEYTTEAHVERRDVVARVVRQVLTTAGPAQTEHPGSIIVQEMVLGDFSGVCFTRNPLAPGSEEMLIEVVPGGNDALTSGKVTPARYLLDRGTMMLTFDEASYAWRQFLPAESWRDLGKEFLKLENLFGYPLDIEWTYKGRELWILQVRPITAYVTEVPRSSHGTRRIGRATTGTRDISSIYAAYRVPPNLRRHMLTVTAVASIVCDNWTGPPIDRRSVIVTSLIHDIGNIVKANYDSFPTLFPEEMQDLQYWKTVQQSVQLRYGRTDQEVTLNIAKELGVEPLNRAAALPPTLSDKLEAVLVDLHTRNVIDGREAAAKRRELHDREVINVLNDAVHRLLNAPSIDRVNHMLEILGPVFNAIQQ